MYTRLLIHVYESSFLLNRRITTHMSRDSLSPRDVVFLGHSLWVRVWQYPLIDSAQTHYSKGIEDNQIIAGMGGQW